MKPPFLTVHNLTVTDKTERQTITVGDERLGAMLMGLPDPHPGKMDEEIVRVVFYDERVEVEIDLDEPLEYGHVFRLRQKPGLQFMVMHSNWNERGKCHIRAVGYPQIKVAPASPHSAAIR